MEELDALYTSHAKCPVCESTVDFTKVRSQSIRLLKQDTDFCPWYEGANPILYEAVICPECGYGSHVTNFTVISMAEKQRIREKISSRWTKRSFKGRRTLDNALEAFKIVLLNLYAREAPKSEVAKICLRIAWIYRYKGDHEQEKKFLQYALDSYKIAYHEEDLSDGRFDEYTCIFIVGELSRRLGQLGQSMQWFSRLISCYSDPKQKDCIPNKMIETTRDLVHEIKSAKAEMKERDHQN